MAIVYLPYARIKRQLWWDANVVWLSEFMSGTDCVWFVPGTVDPME